jgi:hypothetical protein
VEQGGRESRLNATRSDLGTFLFCVSLSLCVFVCSERRRGFGAVLAGERGGEDEDHGTEDVLCEMGGGTLKYKAVSLGFFFFFFVVLGVKALELEG